MWKPSPPIATKFLHCTRRINGIRVTDYRAFDIHVIRAFVFLPDNLSPQLQTPCPLMETKRTCTYQNVGIICIIKSLSQS